MKRKAVITVSTRVRYQDGKQDNVMYTAAGTMEDAADGWRIAYAEPEESGMAGTATLLDVSPTRVELTRAGSVQNYLVFSAGEAIASVYDTPYGKLSVEVHTGSIRTRLNVYGGLLELRYELTVGGVTSDNRLSLRVKTGEGEQ